MTEKKVEPSCEDVVPSEIDVSTPGIIRARFGGDWIELREITPPKTMGGTRHLAQRTPVS
jgi:hypothetical protein